MNTLIIRKCQKCNKKIGNTGFYLQMFQRSDRKNRDNCFLCNDCVVALLDFLEGEQNGEKE